MEIISHSSLDRYVKFENLAKVTFKNLNLKIVTIFSLTLIKMCDRLKFAFAVVHNHEMKQM